MSRRHKLVPTVPYPTAQTVYLGADSSNKFTVADLSKPVKLIGDSRYDLTDTGDDLEGFVLSVEAATENGSSIGAVARPRPVDMVFAIAHGLQATPGTGALAVGEYVVSGPKVARGTTLTTNYPRVCKATDADTSKIKWRVVALSDTSSGAVGQRITIERV